MLKTCKDCKHYEAHEDGRHVMRCKSDGELYMGLSRCGSFEEETQKNLSICLTCVGCESCDGKHMLECSAYVPRNEGTTYTTGQMIDLLMQDTTLEASCYDGKTINTIRYNPSGHFEGVDRYYDFRMSSPQQKWVIEKIKPKRTYKDVFLEKFPKAKIIDTCVNLIFHGIDECNNLHCESCWNREYKEG